LAIPSKRHDKRQVHFLTRLASATDIAFFDVCQLRAAVESNPKIAASVHDRPRQQSNAGGTSLGNLQQF
jgi:hypothetical protein